MYNHKKLHIMYDVNDESRIGLTKSAYRTRGDPTTITVADILIKKSTNRLYHRLYHIRRRFKKR